MPRRNKLLEKAINSPNNLRFQQFETLLCQCEWIFDRQNGSHRIWYSPSGYTLSIQSKKGQAKEYQVKQFLKQYIKETQDE